MKELTGCYPEWAKKVFSDPVVKEELSIYNTFVHIGTGADKAIWRTKEPFNWCEENIGKKDTAWTYLALNIWLFKREEDAVYFKLTWM